MIKYKKIVPILFLTLVFALPFVFSKTAYCATDTKESESRIAHIIDEAGLFDSDSVKNLENYANEIYDTYNYDPIVLTITGSDKTRKAYLEDYYDSVDTIISDAVLLLIDMDPSNRGVEIQGYGECEYTISDNRIESILDDIVPYLSDGDYSDAAELFMKQTVYYTSQGRGSDYTHTQKDNESYNENYYADSQNKSSNLAANTLINLVIAMVIGGVVVFIMVHNSGGRMTTTQENYIDHKNSRILGRYDHYLHTTTSRTPKPKPSDSGGSGFGGGGVSSGGHSHSGGGRSF